jgi:branched-chain amino acid aminotransferase
MSSPVLWLNGRLLPAHAALVSVLDRGFLYGDGLFETVRVANAEPLCWTRHLARLQQGAAFLRIPIPCPADELFFQTLQLIRKNQITSGILRITLSRGTGPRGYSPRDATRPSLAISVTPAPEPDPLHPARWQIITSRVRVAAGDPLTRFKTCNRLPYILARAQADDASANDALLLNTDGHVAESSCANLFWIENNRLLTPPLECGALDGITRARVLELAAILRIDTRQEPATPDRLFHCHGLFLTLTTLGLVHVVSLDHQPLPDHPFLAQLHNALLTR